MGGCSFAEARTYVGSAQSLHDIVNSGARHCCIIGVHTTRCDLPCARGRVCWLLAAGVGGVSLGARGSRGCRESLRCGANTGINEDKGLERKAREVCVRKSMMFSDFAQSPQSATHTHTHTHTVAEKVHTKLDMASRLTWRYNMSTSL